MDKVEIAIENNGKVTKVHCSQEIAEILESPATEPAMKNLICSSLMEGQEVTISCTSTNTTESESPSPRDDKSQLNKTENVSKWTPESEKLLLEAHKKTEESKRIPRNKWLAIASTINEFGYNYTSEQCRLKVKSLREKYERNMKKNKTSGESPASEMDELEETFSSFPDMKPTYVLDSGLTANSDTEAEQPQAKDKGAKPKITKKKTIQSSDEETEEGTPEVSVHKRGKRVKRSSDVIVEFLGDIMQRKEEAAERRHKEKLSTVSSLIDVLKDALNK